jgi:hypothetical protein
LFIASRQDAASYEEREGKGFERIELGGLTSLEFETLWAISENEEWDTEKHVIEEIASTDGTWTFQFPEAYVLKLQSLDAAGMRAAADAWGLPRRCRSRPMSFRRSSIPS